MFLESLLPITIVAGLAWGAYLLGKAHHAIPVAAAAAEVVEEVVEETVEEVVEETVEEDVDDISETNSSDMDTSSDTSEPKRRVLNKSSSWKCGDCGYVGTLDEDRTMCDCYEDDDSNIQYESNTCSWW